VPSFPDLLDLVVERGFDVLHVAAPGPLGVAALAAGHVAGLPVVGAYHTEFGDYAALLTGDRMVGAVVQAALKSFYDRCAVVLAPSATTAAALRERGFGPSPIEVLRNGVDAERFHPGSRNEAVRAGIGDGRVLLLYAGRVGREKGLAALADGYRRLRQRRDDVHLVVVGDGPYRGEMERALGPTASFLGFLHGEALARVVASCDLLLFPSETDTLGRVVIEAQACGVPAVVKTGGPAECLAPGLSGLVVDRGDERAFWEAVVALVDDPARRRAMGRAARGFAEGRAWSAVRSALDEMYLAVARRTPSAADRAAAPAAVPTAGGAPVLA
jgi:glycosyltransferase involved in cell wall biosynthesis